MLPPVCCLLLPPALAEEGRWMQQLFETALHSWWQWPRKRCRAREGPIRALGFHTPYTHSCFIEWTNETFVCCMTDELQMICSVYKEEMSPQMRAKAHGIAFCCLHEPREQRKDTRHQVLAVFLRWLKRYKWRTFPFSSCTELIHGTSPS